MTTKINNAARRHARLLIIDARIARDARDDWSEHAPDAETENSFIDKHGYTEYGTWHLGKDTEKTADTKGRYSFPLAQLESWLKSYRPDELFDDGGRLRAEVASHAPAGHLRMSATAHANGGMLLRSLVLPDYAAHAAKVSSPGVERISPMKTLGSWLGEVIAGNPDNFLLFGPDETASNRLQNVYEVTDKVWQSRIEEVDEHLARAGRIREVLSEHLCQGWLEGYLLTGRHGIFNCYEAFIHIVDSMFNQHAKWLRCTGSYRGVAERIALLPCLAAGPQRLVASRPRIHRPCREQEG